MDRELELAKAVSVAGERVGDAFTAVATDWELRAVPREAWEAVADAAFKLWEAATAAAAEAEGGARAEPDRRVE